MVPKTCSLKRLIEYIKRWQVWFKKKKAEDTNKKQWNYRRDFENIVCDFLPIN